MLTALVFLGASQAIQAAIAPVAGAREFPPGSIRVVSDLPASRFRDRLEKLPEDARQKAVAWLQSFHFTTGDLESLQVDPEGGIYYNDTFSIQDEPSAAMEPPIGGIAVPVDPFPNQLKFHSRPGSANVIYLDFTGETVSNTAWNTSLERTLIPAVAFSTDEDFTTFSDSEQLLIKRIWQRVAEDYAPFEVDVTTERPANLTTRTAHALITRNTDANGENNPSYLGGGVGYVGVFGDPNYANYRPAWIYFNNIANNEAYIGEAVSHEIGHNFGLSHDGITGGTDYYGGHGAGEISWGTIMGLGYNRNVSQWSKGEYYQANNTQDDLMIISGKIPYRADDHGNTIATATSLKIDFGTNIFSTTPENDPAKTNQANKGIIERNTDVDVFKFSTGIGPVTLQINTWTNNSNARGGDLDLQAELYSSDGGLLLTSNPAVATSVRIQADLEAGTYYLFLRNSGAGDPFSATPTGYTSYASLGQYFIQGTIQPVNLAIPPVAQLNVPDLTLPGVTAIVLTVTYSDDVGIDTSSIDGNDLRITGPNGYDFAARFLAVQAGGGPSQVIATYAADAEGASTWTRDANGTYQVALLANQVRDSQGVAAAAAALGQFTVTVPEIIYTADMSVDPQWTLEPLWEYGEAGQDPAGPPTGFTGSRIIGYNLLGDYENVFSPKYATTQMINASGTTELTLRFHRWLGLKNGDTATIEVSTNGVSWSELWSSSQPISDVAWQDVQYALPSWAAGSPSVQVRWGLSSVPGQTDSGWSIDDVQLLADQPAAPTASIMVTASPAGWGAVSPQTGGYPPGAQVEFHATPADYYQFDHWSGDLAGTQNPVSLVIQSNMVVEAVFSEVFTTNHPTPLWWLASLGYTNDFESAVDIIGANGRPLWESYQAGLVPSDPSSQLVLSLASSQDGSTLTFTWQAVEGRIYDIENSPSLDSSFQPLPGATGLTSGSFTLPMPAENPGGVFYRLRVSKP